MQKKNSLVLCLLLKHRDCSMDMQSGGSDKNEDRFRGSYGHASESQWW